ncbi:MAG: threonine/serine dehydratase [Gemmatimonadaceae bacterium]
MEQAPLLLRLPELIAAARERLRPYIRETSCVRSDALSERYGSDVWLKSEHLQHSGSFKARGAAHKLLCLTSEQRRGGVVTASSGNHGAACAWAGRTFGVPVRVFVPDGASGAKVALIRRYGAQVETYGSDGLDTELFAREYAQKRCMPYVSPYNDADVVAGQGTIGMEMLAQLASIDRVYVAVGGGGLIAGVAAAVKARLPNVKVVAALPELSPVMALSIRAGHIVEHPWQPTLSDGTAGGVEPDSITFDLCRALVDDWVLVSEDAIAAAMRDFIAEHHQPVEGAAGVALAALSYQWQDVRGSRVAVVLCGGNVALETLRRVVSAEPPN